MFSEKLKNKICLWLGVSITGGIVGIAYAIVIGGKPIHGMTIGYIITATIFAFELFLVQSSYGNRLRRLPFLIFTLITTLVWSMIISLCLLLIPSLLFGQTEPYNPESQVSSFQQDMLFSLLASFIFNFVLRVRSLIGGRVLSNFVLGRYYQPIEENRVFMFLDLANSTALSEQLGDIRVQSLIGQFFFDIALPVSEHGGETHRYIGDEVVITWPMTAIQNKETCIQCVLDIRQCIEDRKDYYLAEYGVTPQFRIGIHGGQVVAGEVGDDKKEIVYFGDTINTAARLQSLCKTMNKQCIISKKLLSNIRQPSSATIKDMGEVSLSGKALSIEVVSLS